MTHDTLSTLNRLRWLDSGVPFFEVYYLRFHDPRQQVAGWFRIVLTNPRRRAPELSVWATLFDIVNPSKTVHLHQTYPLRDAELLDARNGLTIGACGFTESRWWGSLHGQDRSIQWDLSLSTDDQVFLHLRRPLYDWSFVPMKVLSPHFRTRIRGEVQVSGPGAYPNSSARHVQLDQVMGNASHYWGHRLVEQRVWGFCQSFEEDPDFGFEGASGIAHLLGIPLPRTTFLCFRFQGRRYEFNSPLRTLLNRSHHDLISWHFEAQGQGLRFVGEARASAPANMVAHRWESPDGIAQREQYIHLDSTADLHIEVSARESGRWQVIHRVNAHRMAAFETSLPYHDARVSWVER